MALRVEELSLPVIFNPDWWQGTLLRLVDKLKAPPIHDHIVKNERFFKIGLTEEQHRLITSRFIDNQWSDD